MYRTLLLVGAGLMFVFLVLNVYFRIKVWKHYKELLRYKVEFPTRYIVDTKKLKEEIVPKYPEAEKAILGFSRHIQISLRIASILLMLITLFAAINYYYK